MNPIYERASQVGAILNEPVDTVDQRGALVVGQCRPPSGELICRFDLSHSGTMKHYS